MVLPLTFYISPFFHSSHIRPINYHNFFVYFRGFTYTASKYCLALGQTSGKTAWPYEWNGWKPISGAPSYNIFVHPDVSVGGFHSAAYAVFDDILLTAGGGCIAGETKLEVIKVVDVCFY